MRSSRGPEEARRSTADEAVYYGGVLQPTAEVVAAARAVDRSNGRRSMKHRAIKGRFNKAMRSLARV